MMFSSGKIPIKVYPLFWVLTGLIAWTMSKGDIPLMVLWMLIIFVSVLIHEFGHALTAMAFGQKVSIQMFALGGMTHRFGKKLKLWQEFFVVLNGPLAGFSLFLLAAFVRSWVGNANHSFVIELIVATGIVNLIWTVLNLLPVMPLDGGHLLKIILEGIFGFRGVKFSYFLSMFIAIAVSLLAFSNGEIFIGALFAMFAFESFRTWRGASELTEKDNDAQLQLQLRNGEVALRVGNQEEAYKIFEELRSRCESGLIYTTATEYMSEILSSKGRPKEAFDLLYPLRAKLKPESLRLLHLLAYRSGKWSEAIILGNQSYQYIPGYETALINALCHSIVGDIKPTIGWLQCAIDEGLPDIKETLQKREFDHIRETPQFQALVQKYGT